MISASPETLSAALKSNAGGEVLRLAPGDYTKIRVKGTPKRTAPLTIEADDPASPPRFRGGLTIDNWSNVIFKGLDFDISDATTGSASAVRVYNGEDLTFEGGRLIGNLRPDDRWGYGLNIAGVKRLRVAGMVGHNLKRGFVIGSSEDIEIVDNDLVGLGTDGIDLSAITRGVVARNRLEDFYPIGGDHPDGFQFMAPDEVVGCVGVKVFNNLVNARMRPGRFRCQGVFVKANDASARHDDIEIFDNLFVNVGWHGIAAYNVANIQVSGNELLFVPEAVITPKQPENSWVMLKDCGGACHDNKAPAFLLGDFHGEASGNVEIPFASDEQVQAAVKAWVEKFRSAPNVPAEPPPRDLLRDALAVRTGAKIEPLKTKGRVIIDLKTPARAQSLLAAIQAVPVQAD